MDALRRSVEAERPVASRSKAAERKKPAKETERQPVKGALDQASAWGSFVESGWRAGPLRQASSMELVSVGWNASCEPGVSGKNCPKIWAIPEIWKTWILVMCSARAGKHERSKVHGDN